MEAARVQSLQRNLLLVGLLLSGFLAGILLMLILERRERAVPQEVRTVEFHTNAAPQGPQDDSILDALQLNEQFKLVASKVKRAVVSVHATSSWYNLPCAVLKRRSNEYRERENLGSGVLISPQGYIVTNYHLVENTCGLRVTFVDKQEYDAELVGVDESTELAVIRIMMEPESSRAPLSYGDSDLVETGEWVLAVGNPLELTSTVTAGIVSALGRRVNVINNEFSVEDFIQTDAVINPGNSGGALVNLRGELVGINTAIATQTGFNEGYGFAIPVNLVDRVVRDLIAYGEVKRAYMGISLDPVDWRSAQELGLDHASGVKVNYVRRGGAAHKVGLRDGDVILTVGGKAVNEPNELQSIIARRRPGDSLTITAWRRGQINYHVVPLVGEDDPAIAAWISTLSRGEVDESPHNQMYPVERWGLILRPLTAADVRKFGAKSGVFIAHVERDDPASRAGVPSSVVLERVNGEVVTSAIDAWEMLEDLDEAVLGLLDGEGKSLTVLLPKR